MEELLLEMKLDVTKLSTELGKLSSVSGQLKVDELSILGRLAAGKGGGASTTNSQSVLTLSKSVGGYTSSVVTSSAAGLATSSSAPGGVKPVEGVMVMPNTSSGGVQYAAVQQTTQAQTGSAAYVGVPSYVDGTTLYLQNQAVPVVPGQQVRIAQLLSCLRPVLVYHHSSCVYVLIGLLLFRLSTGRQLSRWQLSIRVVKVLYSLLSLKGLSSMLLWLSLAPR